MESYRAELLSERGVRTRARAQGESGGEPRASRADLRRDAAERRQQLAPLRRAMQAAEKRLEVLTGEIATIDAALADPALYARDAAKAQRLVLDRGLKAKSLAEAEEAWLAATEALEAAEGAA
jgi:ATP-binding cassette subfamily F protein 3